jgi:hypothetical protein
MLTSLKLKYVVIIWYIVTKENTTQLCVLFKRNKEFFTFQMIVTYVIPSQMVLSGDRSFETHVRTLKQKRRRINLVAILFAT